MKNKKPTVTIGIPAFNEEANINYLIRDILDQKRKKYILEDIIIVSDGSTDKTIQEVNKIKTKKIKLIINKIREGLYKTQNKIFKSSNSSILILLNADIRIKDKNFIEKLSNLITKKNIDLITPRAIELYPKTYFEKILYVSANIKNNTFEKFKNGKNVYTCRGVARGFSKRLYKKMVFKNSIGEDAFSYFYCVKNSYKYYFTKQTNILFKLPDNFGDHKKQSLRFFESQKLLKKYFGDDFVTQNYKLPKITLLKSLIYNLAKERIFTVCYIFLVIFLKMQSLFIKNNNKYWTISKSSKMLKI